MKVASLVALAGLTFGASSQPFSCFPRMREMPSVRPFERQMPEMPAHVEPFGARSRPATREEAARVPNPVAPSVEARELGRVYYGYYCLMCHGEGGRGDGAVGVSYAPRPTDLTSAQVQAMADGELAFALAVGNGHEPVLEATVPWERRWYIVEFIRAIAGRRPTRPG